MKMRIRGCPAITIITVVIAAGLLASSAAAYEYTWNTTSGGSWATADNWDKDTDGGASAVPNAAGEVVHLRQDIAAATTITLDGDRTIGVLNIGDLATTWSYYVIATGDPAGSLIFDNGANPAQLNTHGNYTTITTAQITAPVVLTSDLIMSRASGNGVLNISGVVSGAGNLAVTSGSFYLSCTNNTGFTGNISISGGATLRAYQHLSLGANASTRSIFFNNGTLNIEGYTSAPNCTLVLDLTQGPGTVRLQGAVGVPRIGNRLNGNGDFTKTGGGSARISANATNRDNADTYITQGSLAISAANTLGTNANVYIHSQNATANPSFSFAFGQTANTWVFNRVDVGGANDFGGRLDLNQEAAANVARVWAVSALYMQSGTNTVGFAGSTGTHTLRLNGNVTVNATARAGSVFREPASSTSGRIDLNGGNRVFAVAAGTPTSGMDLRVSIPLVDLAGGGVLTKEGAGLMVLDLRAGDSTYAGGTVVANGTLSVQNTAGSATGTGAVTVGENGTLSGNGIISGAVTVDGTLAPGVSPGTLTISNTLTLTGTAKLNFELHGTDLTIGGGINDLVDGVTDLTLGGALNVSETSPGTFLLANLGDKWRLINYSGNLTDNGLALGTMPTLSGGLAFAVDTATTGQINLSIIPEPATVGLGLSGLALLLLRRRVRG